jgi:hypothetical protein
MLNPELSARGGLQRMHNFYIIVVEGGTYCIRQLALVEGN